jgi:hypothetical protein
MYRAEFWFLAAGRDGRGVFWRHLDVPFVPARGLRVRFPEDADYDEGWRVREANWLAAEGKFHCRLEGDVHADSAWEDLREHYLARGWTLEEDGAEGGDNNEPDGDVPPWLRNCRGVG